MFNRFNWILYFFSKIYTIGMTEKEMSEIIATAESTGVPNLYLAHLAFQLECNGYTGKAAQIITAAKVKHPDFPFEAIPEYVIEDEEFFQAGGNEEDIIQKRDESMYLTFTGKEMKEDTKALHKRFRENAKKNDSARSRIKEGFALHDFVMEIDGGVIAGEITGICTTEATGNSRLQLLTESGEYGFGLAHEFRLMTKEEKDSFQKKRKYIKDID